MEQVKQKQAEEQQKEEASATSKSNATLSPESDQRPAQGRRRAPTIILDRVDDLPTFGEDPGPNGSLERKEAYEKRKMDSTPDEVRIREQSGGFL